MRAAASEQDAAIYLTAAFTGLRRGELLAFYRIDRPQRRRACWHASTPAVGGKAIASVDWRLRIAIANRIV